MIETFKYRPQTKPDMKYSDNSLEKNEHKKIIEFSLDINSIINFTLATKDPNEIHNPKFISNPIIPGFQLESLVAHYTEKNKTNKSGHLESIETKFKKFAYSNQPLSLELTYKDDKVSATLLNCDETITTTTLKYSPTLSVQLYQKNNNSVRVSRKMVDEFYDGINISHEKEFPNLILPSLSSYAIKDKVSKHLVPGTKPIYLKHNIKFYSPIVQFKRNKRVYLNIESFKKTSRMDKIIISGGDKKNNKLFDAEILLSYITDEKLDGLLH